jgi:hypothetical protein
MKGGAGKEGFQARTHLAIAWLKRQGLSGNRLKMKFGVVAFTDCLANVDEVNNSGMGGWFEA